MAANFKGDQELRAGIVDFISGAIGDIMTPAANVQAGLNAGADFRLVEGVAFLVTAPTRAAQARIVKRCNAILGPVISHEKDIDGILWKEAAAYIKTSPPPSDQEALNRFLDALQTGMAMEVLFIENNYCVMLEDGIDHVTIGPVTAILNDKLSAELAIAHPDAKWKIEKGAPSISFGGAASTVTLTPVVWSVNLTSSKQNVYEHALWLIDVAISLLRLNYTQAPAFFPKIGDVEVRPTLPARTHSTALSLSGTTASFGGSWVPPHYRIGSSVQAITIDPKFISHAQKVFDAKKGSVSERVAQGLGWLSRGRQAGDRAERLLFFFTAIEALLSSDDKSAPVVQTIARHASVILTDTPKDRAENAKRIKALYSDRSSLVHAGKRSVTKSSADTTQYIAESLYHRVLENVDLSSDLSKFHNKLAEASYGLPWP